MNLTSNGTTDIFLAFLALSDDRGSGWSAPARVDRPIPGIPRGLRQKIFEPFFTTKGEKGTGLGLWVTKSRVEKHDGNLRVRSMPGVGTVFSIFLPQAHPMPRLPERMSAADRIFRSTRARWQGHNRDVNQSRSLCASQSLHASPLETFAPNLVN
jgi:Histidine kinase-, DNA gyrase B-, and HSP90-like ATPase